MKNPFSAWNVNAKIGINMIKPETSGNKPMLHDIKIKSFKNGVPVNANRIQGFRRV